LIFVKFPQFFSSASVWSIRTVFLGVRMGGVQQFGRCPF